MAKIKNIYFQIQYNDAENINIHSDGCFPAADLDRKSATADSHREFCHKLLDEWLDHFHCVDNLNHEESLTDGAHIIFAPCHHENEE